MNMPPNHGDFNRGVDLFNRAHFFDAHEVIEDVWRSLPRDRPSRRHLRLHIQGLVQLAVAFHHESKGNHVGARSVLERAMRNLNSGHDRMTRFEMPLKRRFLSQNNRWVISVWNKGKRDSSDRPRDGTKPPWTVFQNGKEIVVKPIQNQMGVEIGILEIGGA
jgi:hypothetical protein